MQSDVKTSEKCKEESTRSVSTGPPAAAVRAVGRVETHSKEEGGGGGGVHVYLGSVDYDDIGVRSRC